MDRVLSRLAGLYDIDRFRRTHRSPYRILIGCVISLRTKDDVTYAATARLFDRVLTPEEMSRLRESTIAGFRGTVGR